MRLCRHCEWSKTRQELKTHVASVWAIHIWYLVVKGSKFWSSRAGLKVLLRVSDSVVLQGISTSIPQTVALPQLDAFQILLEVFPRGLLCSSYKNVLLRHLGRHSSDRQFPPPTRCSSCPSTSSWQPTASRQPFLRWLQYSFNRISPTTSPHLDVQETKGIHSNPIMMLNIINSSLESRRNCLTTLSARKASISLDLPHWTCRAGAIAATPVVCHLNNCLDNYHFW